MDKHACKLCNRSFPNGRALGGHMRSHVAATSAAASYAKSLPAADYSSSSTFSREAEEEKGLGYGLRENPKKSFRMVDPEFSPSLAAAAAGNAGSSVVQDGESETESSPQALAAPFPSRRKHAKRPRFSDATLELLEIELLNSFPDVTPEEDLAITFMLLSRDVWNKYGDEDEADDEDEMKIEAKPLPPPTKGRSRYQCGTCKKVFRSYQALGGHRASHKKSRSCLPPADDTKFKDAGSPEANVDGKSVIHVCQICFREFGTGQGLGGHKRSHISSSTAAITISTPPPPAKLVENSFDLNLPAQLDEDTELSAVSNLSL